MKPDRLNRHAAALMGLLLLACVAWLASPAPAGAQQPLVPDGEVRISDDLALNQPVIATFDLKGYELPAGTYASINVRFPAAPNGPRPSVKTGYPQTTVRFHTPGTYRVTLILNQVSKPSCGGVDATLLLEETVELTISH